MSDHSPLPWTAKPFSTGYEILDKDGKLVAIVPHYHTEWDFISKAANAALILSAPKLLEACEDSIRDIQERIDLDKARPSEVSVQDTLQCVVSEIWDLERKLDEERVL